MRATGNLSPSFQPCEAAAKRRKAQLSEDTPRRGPRTTTGNVSWVVKPAGVSFTRNIKENLKHRRKALVFATIEETKAPQVGQPTVHLLVGRRVRYLVAPPKKNAVRSPLKAEGREYFYASFKNRPSALVERGASEAVGSGFHCPRNDRWRLGIRVRSRAHRRLR